MNGPCRGRRYAKTVHAAGLLALLMLLVGCTPQEQQAFINQLTGWAADLAATLITDHIQQFFTFGLSFGRSGLAAFLL
jgi:hypothetical protein